MLVGLFIVYVVTLKIPQLRSQREVHSIADGKYSNIEMKGSIRQFTSGFQRFRIFSLPVVILELSSYFFFPLSVCDYGVLYYLSIGFSTHEKSGMEY